MSIRVETLVCPETKQQLLLLPRAAAERRLAGAATLVGPVGNGYQPIGPTDTVLLRSDGLGAYPVIDGFPVLLAPEMLVPAGTRRTVDINDPRYAEAYEEMDHYDEVGRAEAREVRTSKAAQDLTRLASISGSSRASFPDPPGLWLDAKYELAAQHDAFRHLRPLDGVTAMQIGGRGLHAVRFLLAGAQEAYLVSPMVGELVFATALARECGVADRLHCVAALAEELPFPNGSFDVIYSQGCVHHWLLPLAMPECARILRPGGRFAAVEPWRGPLYGIGTKILGKRDPNVHCVVLDESRVAEPLRALGSATVAHHGALSRYPLLGLWKLGVKPGRRTVWKISRLDDRITARFPRLNATGSSVAILAAKAPEQVPLRASTDL